MQNGSKVTAPVEVSTKAKNSNGCSLIAADRCGVDKHHQNEGGFSISSNGELQNKNKDARMITSDVNSISKSKPLDAKMVQYPITKCILTANHRLLLECLTQGEDPNAVCSNSGRTYLHLIAQAATTDRELTWVPMVYQLSNAGAAMSAFDNAGMTACGLAISKKLVQIVAALLKCGAELRESDWFHAEQIRGVVKAEMLEIMRRLSPSYWSAATDLTPFKANRLVKAWARVNVSRNGLTLIEYAKQVARDETIIKLLVHHEASIELAHAVMAGDKERVRTLLCDSAIDLNTADTSVKNNSFEPIAPLSLNGAAIKLGHVDVLNELIAAKDRLKSSSCASVSSGASSDGRSYAAYSGRSRSMQESNPTVVFYKGRSGSEEVCEIRTANKPVTSALCTIL